jgi:aspartate/glutamate racemase
MKPRAIGIVAGGGGPLGSSSVLQNIITECQQKYNSWRSYEFPCINFYSFPYSEMLLTNNSCSIPSRELSYCIQQLKLVGMEIVVIPCFTMSSYLTYRNYGIELIEMGAMMHHYLEKNNIKDPLVLCTERTRKSGYCDRNFECHYPNETIQKELNCLIEHALKGEKVDMQPIVDKLPDEPIVCACTVLNGQMQPIDNIRWINPNELLAEYVVYRSYEGNLEEQPLKEGFIEIQRDAVISSP